jgi:hypothetical protein
MCAWPIRRRRFQRRRETKVAFYTLKYGDDRDDEVVEHDGEVRLSDGLSLSLAFAEQGLVSVEYSADEPKKK